MSHTVSGDENIGGLGCGSGDARAGQNQPLPKSQALRAGGISSL